MDTSTVRLTTAQALVRFLQAQVVARDGARQALFDGCLGIFGHGNVGGLGQALHEARADFRYYLGRNEQSMVHIAAAYARARDRLSVLAVTSSIGPGSTNLVTGAAGATINRLPVLLLPADMPASRRPRPVLQQLEHAGSATVSVNDCLRPVSVYWDRIERPEQLLWAAPEAVRVLTDQALTGAVTLALPTDVQSEAHDFPVELFRERVWTVRRPRPDDASLAEAARLIAAARRPFIVAGGGVIYSGAGAALRRLVDATGIPVGETMAGKGALPHDHPSNAGAFGVNGTPGAFELAQEADVVIGIGTRWTDVTSVSQTAFAHPDVRFVNVNVAAFDAHKFSGVALVGDARATVEALTAALDGYDVGPEQRERVARMAAAWDAQVQRYVAPAAPDGAGLTQAEVVGAVNDAAGDTGVVVCAAGSLPNDLHKLWRARDPKSYHVEYGYSCMGYEIPGGIGVALADPARDVFVVVGDGSYMMAPSELVTAVQEGVRLVVVLVQNHGFASVGALSNRLGAEGFGTRY
ncbi:MAG TPA: 3D-(3,5/4)-trihydroxycyclohexane-1,2-dione acylhydrolase (decyclizing), partial [Euzebyales bacterium]|nr:3D-(3,5/4)-trihydroxycyclohexane-1,2-dione acylhydrolase (decyclizing) [Euzebyales bacterium]